MNYVVNVYIFEMCIYSFRYNLNISVMGCIFNIQIYGERGGGVRYCVKNIVLCLFL